MKPVVLSLLILVLTPGIPGAQGVLDSGGGVRTGGGVRVQDSLGPAVAGTAGDGTVLVETGIVSGLPAFTPVELANFHLALVDGGIEIRWEADEVGRFFGFFLDRAEASGDEPAEADFVKVEATFAGPGPHAHVDRDVVSGRTYHYRLRALRGIGETDIYGPWTIRYAGEGAAFRPVILPASPNPFRDAFALRLSLAEATTITWSLHDVQGRRLAGGGIGQVPAGYHAFTVRPRHQSPSGIYFLRIRAGALEDVQKLVNLP